MQSFTIQAPLFLEVLMLRDGGEDELERPEGSELAKQLLGLFQQSIFLLSALSPMKNRGISPQSGLLRSLLLLLEWFGILAEFQHLQ